MEHAIRSALKSQYRSALRTLRDAVTKCPEDLWYSDAFRTRCWQGAYHALFFAHFYGGRDEASFEPWEQHQSRCQVPDGLVGGPGDPESDLPLGPEPYTKEQVLAYCDFCLGRVDAAVDDLDLAREECGFPWYPISKLEHQIVNIRHIQHHAAQLADRVRTAVDVGVDWVGATRPDRGSPLRSG